MSTLITSFVSSSADFPFNEDLGMLKGISNLSEDLTESPTIQPLHSLFFQETEERSSLQEYCRSNSFH